MNQEYKAGLKYVTHQNTSVYRYRRFTFEYWTLSFTKIDAMQFKFSFIGCLTAIFVCSAVSFTSALPVSNAREDTGIKNLLSNAVKQVRLTRDIDDDTIFPFVSRFDELRELGNNSKTVCPFQVDTKIKEQEHQLGNVSVQYNEIVCAGECANCGEGRSCKQLITTFEVLINSTVSELPDKMLITDVGIGCACTPDDTGAPGEPINK